MSTKPENHFKWALRDQTHLNRASGIKASKQVLLVNKKIKNCTTQLMKQQANTQAENVHLLEPSDSCFYTCFYILFVQLQITTSVIWRRPNLYYDISGNKCAVELLSTGRKESFPGQAHLRSKCAHNVKILTNTGEQQDDGGLPRSPPSLFGGLPSQTTASCHDIVGSAAAHNHLQPTVWVCLAFSTAA